MVLYGQLIIDIKVSKVEMLRLLKRIYFDKIYTKEGMKSTYRLVIGREPGELISETGEYRLVVTKKKRVKLSLQNLKDDVIYNYTVGIGFLWKNAVQDAMSEAILDISFRSGIL